MIVKLLNYNKKNEEAKKKRWSKDLSIRKDLAVNKS